MSALPAGFGAALGIFGGLSAHDSARDTNKSIRKQAQSVNQSVAIQQQQIADSESLERLKRFNEAARVQGALRVAAGQAGQDFSGSFARLSQQATIDQAINAEVLRRNADNQIALIRSQGQSNLFQLESGLRNPLLDAITGGLGGVTAGLQIGSAIGSFLPPQQTDPAGPASQQDQSFDPFFKPPPIGQPGTLSNRASGFNPAF